MQLRPLLGGVREGFFGFAGLRLKESYQAKNGLLNSYLRLRLPPDRPLGTAERMMHLLPKRVRWHLERDSRKEAAIAGQLRDQEQVEMELAVSAIPAVPRSTIGARFIGRLLTKAIGTSARTGSTLVVRNFMEMEPHPANRVTLSSRTDAFNTPLPLVTHAPTVLDKESICALHRVLRTELERSGFGTLYSDLTPDLDPWPIATDSSHHMGTTRMGSSDAVSVVNENCKIHSSSNVFIAGSSVFPTSGSANPTYTIVALAIRLADHLDDRLHEW
jgi:choline dehydrogenase-like flavoprotein